LAQTRTTLYAVLKPLVRLGLRTFFSKVTVVGMEKIPADRPVILVSNHQNAMLDPLVLCVESKRQLHWLTRADVFKKPAINKLLRNFNMLPVYRERDRVEDLSGYNKVTFDECNERLKDGAIICMFPEGTHRGKKQLVPLKKGVARLALNALESDMHHACIVPVGIEYEDFYNYRKELLLVVGEPIDLTSYEHFQESDRAKVQTDIIRAVRLGLEEVMIDIENEHAYHEAIATQPLFAKLSGTSDALQQFRFFQRFAQRLGKTQNEFSLGFEEHAKDYIALGKKLHLQEKYFDEKASIAGLSLALIVLGLPAAIGALVFSPIYYATESFVKKVVRDPLFKNSIRAAFWTFITPIWLLLIWAILLLTGVGALVGIGVVAGLVVCGIIALQWWPIYQKWKETRLHAHYKRTANSAYHTWLAKRSGLIQWIKEFKENKEHV
jgi:1-acyl-sn-glycerol-3-phosphate acyltransferase